MKSVTAVFNHHNRGLFAALALTAFAATIIFVWSFAAVDADDGTEETHAVDSCDMDAESPDDNYSGNIRINFRSNDSKMGTLAYDQLSMKSTGTLPSFVMALAIANGDFGMVFLLKITLIIPTGISFNFATPSDGYEVDHWTLNGKEGKYFRFVLDGNTFTAHFKEKGTMIVP